MWQYLLHLWAPPAQLGLECPPPAPGEEPDPFGIFDPLAVSTAYQWAAFSAAIAVLLAVLACYLLHRGSLNRRFVRRWWAAMLLAATVGALMPLVMLYLAVPQHALAGSCSTNPLPFAATYPIWLALNRSLAGFVWCMLAFGVLSFLLTRVAGWHPAAGGFFHNRGCPWPRVNPFGA